MSIGIWPWVVLGIGLFLGFVALVVAIIAVIKTKKFLMPILIYLPFLLISLSLIGIFVYQVLVHYDDYDYDDDWYYNYDTNTDYDYSYGSTYDESNYYDGLIKNYDYNFIINVGADRELNFWSSRESYPIEGITDTYYYCYLTTDYEYEDYYCGTGWAEAFIIDVYTESQWQAIQGSSIAGTLMGQDGGYYFTLSHPNGVLPSDVPTTESYYNNVIYSIEFTD